MRALLFPLLIVAPFVISTACTQSGPGNQELDISLYSGIRQVASIGDTEQQIAQKVKWSTDRTELPADPTVDRIKFSHMVTVKDIGTRIYFRNGRVALIEAQEPFRGKVQGKNVSLFSMSVPPEKTWEEILIRDFGPPQSRASGGRFGAEALFYSWGDVSYNKMGPNEIAIYRDPEIARFRQKYFGRDVKFFNAP